MNFDHYTTYCLHFAQADVIIAKACHKRVVPGSSTQLALKAAHAFNAYEHFMLQQQKPAP
ncbi:hypothetical protein [Clostridium sp. BSD2780061688b_171218_E8]|jgi:hypothetical protein|uniref:hypothetical protein n=1 Tax=Clostridium sp. BSD2780061688b_171218_E8 TaxID=2787146 RepID=UPI001A9B6BD7|nr:hypothetical protein [Clostridium sp. BSD2780061688b_171218_E8]